MDLAYVWYETARAMLTPARLAADAALHSLGNPGNPFAYGPYARSTAAALEMSSGSRAATASRPSACRRP